MTLPAMASTSRSALRRALPTSMKASTSASHVASARQLHSLPPIQASVANGCEPFLNKESLDIIWTQWQKGLLERLNAQVRESELETKSLVQTVFKTAEKPDQILAFNYAAQALNNAFFLSQLKKPIYNPGQGRIEPIRPPQGRLRQAIDQHFGSLERLKEAFSEAALALPANGFVWLVQDHNDDLGIVPMNGAGTILVPNRLQPGLDVAAAQSEGEEQAEEGSEEETIEEVQQEGAKVQIKGPAQLRPHFLPLLCLSMYEHNWLKQYGIWGKDKYVQEFWTAVNWPNVERTHENYALSLPTR